jgi:hypothetical protein
MLAGVITNEESTEKSPSIPLFQRGKASIFIARCEVLKQFMHVYQKIRSTKNVTEPF